MAIKLHHMLSARQRDMRDRDRVRDVRGGKARSSLNESENRSGGSGGDNWNKNGRRKRSDSYMGREDGEMDEDGQEGEERGRERLKDSVNERRDSDEMKTREEDRARSNRVRRQRERRRSRSDSSSELNSRISSRSKGTTSSKVRRNRSRSRSCGSSDSNSKTRRHRDRDDDYSKNRKRSGRGRSRERSRSKGREIDRNRGPRSVAAKYREYKEAIQKNDVYRIRNTSVSAEIIPKNPSVPQSSNSFSTSLTFASRTAVDLNTDTVPFKLKEHSRSKDLESLSRKVLRNNLDSDASSQKCIHNSTPIEMSKMYTPANRFQESKENEYLDD